ncbi:MAG: rhodanese-like domain-containing protein [Rhodococcus sp. (in: high G+C Gram-positive bacteria)]|uniref:rhodanese-like domain-containing protein n=1 Tax=Rhodococcus sp. TaxID=1831 RepID=UPI002AD8B4FC|nr:rhodanese-like domain-containing protein [Rhodococcus sp. (in: high G+C Gram-positive bacteria)]
MKKSDFQQLLIEPEIDEVEEDELGSLSDPILVDVRTEDEYQLGHIAFSANCPLRFAGDEKTITGSRKTVRAVLRQRPSFAGGGLFFSCGKDGYNVVTLRDGIRGQNLSDRLVKEKGYVLRDGILEASR